MHKTIITVVWILLTAMVCIGQSSYLGLKPGESTRDAVVKVLGQPVRIVDENMSEYRPQQGTGAIYVEYRVGGDVVNRIEVDLLSPLSRTTFIQDMQLPEQAEARKNDSKGRLIEYFGAPKYLTLNHVSGEMSSDVRRVGYFSEELFNLALGKSTSSSVVKNTQPGSNTQQYNSLIESARGALQAQDSNQAIRLGQQAVGLDPSQFAAYEIIGIAELYGLHDIDAAGVAMRAAVERGGSASFGAFHDHDGFFQTYCRGSLYVNKFGVSFRADDGRHAFVANYSEIKEAKLNSFVGSNFYSFHLKIVDKNGKAKNYNFAPGTGNAAESNLLLALIQKAWKAAMDSP